MEKLYSNKFYLVCTTSSGKSGIIKNLCPHQCPSGYGSASLRRDEQKTAVSNRSPQDASRRSEKNFFIPCFRRRFFYNAGTGKTVLKPFFHRHYEMKKDGKAVFFVMLKFQT